ncbi:DUF732 domain-containing protein [Haloechinothrix salitolerans]|uniref:DUF732 domain-containing protein n=1 Tax=Haloechinothrix salitolerans TaxID=926830 RepID=A0ABW2C5E9_9PSEU
MLRRLLRATLAACLIAALAACSGDDVEEPLSTRGGTSLTSSPPVSAGTTGADPMEEIYLDVLTEDGWLERNMLDETAALALGEWVCAELASGTSQREIWDELLDRSVMSASDAGHLTGAARVLCDK